MTNKELIIPPYIEVDNGNKYFIGERINEGGFGLIHEGIDNFGNSLAIKIFKPENRFYEQVKKEWEKEYLIMEKVRHPNVLMLIDAFECENLFYLVFERAWGNLFDFVRTFGKQSEESVIEIARQLLSGLHYIHYKNIIHKDLTINNVLVCNYGSNNIFKISDFGISKDFSNMVSLWNVDKVSKTQLIHPHFVPPEFITHGFTTFQSDLYHLGLILLFCYLGDLPFVQRFNSTENIQSVLDGQPRQYAEAMNTKLGEFISILLRRRLEYRFQSTLDAWTYFNNLDSN